MCSFVGVRIFLIAVLLSLGLAACDNTPPEIVSMTLLSNTTSEVGPYEVFATVVDDSVVEVVELKWRQGGAVGENQVVPMAELDGVWVGSIPGQPVGTVIEYIVVAKDDEGKETAFPVIVATDGVTAPAPHGFQVVDPTTQTTP